MQGIQPQSLTDEEWVRIMDAVIAETPKPTEKNWQTLMVFITDANNRLTQHLLKKVGDDEPEPKDPRQLDLF